MKKNGFTLVEILAVLIILGLLIALSIPAYTSVLTDVKRDNHNSKLTEIEIAANKYGEKIKDDIKNAGSSCYTQQIKDLIKKGYLLSESDYDDIILDPTTGSSFEGSVKTCYCKKKYDIQSHYVEEFNPNKVYHEKDKVIYNNKIYLCNYTYPGDNSGIDGLYHDDRKNKNFRYFDEISC